MSDFLDLAAAKGTANSRKVTSGPVMSTRSGLEVVGLMSVEILVENH